MTRNSIDICNTATKQKNGIPWESEVEIALDRLERRIYSLNYDGHFTKSFFKELEKVLGLVAAFRVFFHDNDNKIHAYHAEPNIVRDDESNAKIVNLVKTFDKKKGAGFFPIQAIDCLNEYPGCKSRIELNVCSCNKTSSLVNCDDQTQCDNGVKSQGIILLYSQNESNIFQKFFNNVEWFKEIRELFNENEEPECFGKTEECNKKCDKWQDRCHIKNRQTIPRLDLDEVVQQLREKFNNVLSGECAELPILIYNPLTRFLSYRAIDYMEFPKDNYWDEYKNGALQIILANAEKNLNIANEISLATLLLEGVREIKSEAIVQQDELNKKIEAYKKEQVEKRQNEYNNIVTKLNKCKNYEEFRQDAIGYARSLFNAAIQRVDTGLTKDVWESFENFSVPVNDLKLPTKEEKGERLRKFCEYLFLTRTRNPEHGRNNEKIFVNVTPLGYLGQKLGIIFAMPPESRAKSDENRFLNIAREFAPLLFHSLQSQAYREALKLLEKRRPNEAISILCEVLPRAFNINAISFYEKNRVTHYGFAYATEGEVFDLLIQDVHCIAINDLLFDDVLESFKHNDATYDLRSYSKEGQVYSSKHGDMSGTRKIRTRSRLLLKIDPHFHKKLPIAEGVLDIFFDLSEYALRRNALDIVREIEFIADLIFEAARQKQDVMQQALRSAVSAIMGRNMSHNIGSHVLARYSLAIKNDLEPPKDKEGKSKPDHRGDFLSYLQRRMDFLAEVATSDQTFWAQPLSLKEQLNYLNYEVQRERFFDAQQKNSCVCATKTDKKENRPVLLSHITGKESLLASVEFGLPGEHCPSNDAQFKGGYLVKPAQNDVWFSCPGGEVGVHALFVILENIIRNSARHGSENDCGLVRVFVHIEDDQDALSKGLIKLVVIDPRTKLAADGRVIRRNLNGQYEPSASDKDLQQEKERLAARIGSHSLYDDETGKRKKLCRLNWEINSIIMDESFLDGSGNPNPHYWGLREMQICAHYLQGLPLSELERRSLDKTSTLEAGIHALDDGTHCLKYTFYVQLPKLMTAITHNHAQLMPEKGVQVICQGESSIDWGFISEVTRGYSFLVLEDGIPRPSDKAILASLPVRTFNQSVEEIQKVVKEVQDGNGLMWMESLHETACMYYRDKRTTWKGKPVWGCVVHDEGLKPPTTITEPLFWEKLNTNNQDFDPFPESFENQLEKLATLEIAAAWLDHPSKKDLENNSTSASLGQAGRNKRSEGWGFEAPTRNWVCSEASYSDRAHTGFLNTAAHEGLKWELLAAALPRVAVIDERIQSAWKSESRDISLGNIIWPNMGVWVPPPGERCNLDKPSLNDCKNFLKAPTELPGQLPIDFLVIHLTILERLKKLEGDNTLKETIKKLVEDTEATEANIIVVTGRGVPTVARALDSGDHLAEARYLPISALHASLVLRPSKLALMRALWSAGCPQKMNE